LLKPPASEEPLSPKVGLERLLGSKPRNEMPTYGNVIYTNLLDFQPYHLVYVDESEYDKRIGFRGTSWSPLSVAPIQVSQFHRD
jgi:hypothetical protein